MDVKMNLRITTKNHASRMDSRVPTAWVLKIKSEVRCIIMLRFLNGSKIEIPKLVNNKIINEVSNMVAQIRARLLLLQALEN